LVQSLKTGVFVSVHHTSPDKPSEMEGVREVQSNLASAA